MKIIQKANLLEIHINGFKSILMGLVLTVFGFYGAAAFYNESKSMVPVLLAGIFALGGVALIFYSKSRSIFIEKEGVMTIVEKYLISMGDKPKKQSTPTASIVAVNLTTYTEQNKNSDGNITRKRVSELSLQLKNNDLINIQKSSGGNLQVSGFEWIGLITKAPLSNQAEQIANFLGIPLKRNNNG